MYTSVWKFRVVFEIQGNLIFSQKIEDSVRPSVFVFVNFSSKWSNVYKSLEEIEIFQFTISKCGAILENFGVNLVEILDNCESTLFNGYISAITIQVICF